MSKPTGLASFSRKTTASTSTTAQDGEQPQVTQARPVARRRRGQGETVSLTIRLSRGDWERVHQLAVSEGVSIQTLMVLGLSKVFAEKGLPDLSS